MFDLSFQSKQTHANVTPPYLATQAESKAALTKDPNMPRSRLMLAVPFLGKDVPSQSSEFAHPDVIIGLTVLAYRYSGMRPSDFAVVIWDGKYSHPPRLTPPCITHGHACVCAVILELEERV